MFEGDDVVVNNGRCRFLLHSRLDGLRHEFIEVDGRIVGGDGCRAMQIRADSHVECAAVGLVGGFAGFFAVCEIPVNGSIASISGVMARTSSRRLASGLVPGGAV